MKINFASQSTSLFKYTSFAGYAKTEKTKVQLKIDGVCHLFLISGKVA